MTDANLTLIITSVEAATCGLPALCRRPGCSATAVSSLGFCRGCGRRYDVRAALRWRFVELVCARLTAAGDPLWAVFGGSRHAFGAHVAAHLEELDAQHVHVPASAVDDYVAELDDRARWSA